MRVTKERAIKNKNIPKQRVSIASSNFGIFLFFIYRLEYKINIWRQLAL